MFLLSPDTGIDYVLIDKSDINDIINEQIFNLPFGDCINDPLHQMGYIQSDGALLALDASTHQIEYCSANTEAILGVEPSVVLRQTGEQYFAARWPDMLRLALDRGFEKLIPGSFPKPLNVVAHQQGNYLIFELAVEPESGQHWWNYAERVLFLREMAGSRTLEECRSLIVRWLFERSGFDRVMLYQLLPDMHGEVVQEMRRPAMKSYLGFHFPASDIPPNAHRLYSINWQRVIVDVESTDVPLLSRLSNAPPLDLTRSMLRAVHPVHIQYLKNMEVRSSFSVSIMVKDVLYGLAVCHNITPRTLTLSDRLAFEEIARMVSMHLETLLELLERDTHASLREQLSRLEGALSSTRHDARVGLSRNLGLIQKMFSAGGAWLRLSGEDFFTGDTPVKDEIDHLEKSLKTMPRDDVSSSHALPHHLTSFPGLASLACGVLFIPLNDLDFVVLIRPEMVQTIKWAGKTDDDADNPEQDVAPLTPRSSFAGWVEQTRCNSTPWTSNQMEFAAELREDLLNYISRAHLENVALHDSLTGLANRSLFDQRLLEAIDQFKFHGSSCAVHMLDLDQFKPVNDTLGHAAGDLVLQEVAARLLKLTRHDDTVARLGGDEFAIIQTGVANDQSATILAEKIVSEIAKPYAIDGETVLIGISTGIAIYPQDSFEAADLIQLADTALYTAKRSGKNRHCRYMPGMKLR